MATIQIFLNGESTKIAPQTTVTQLLCQIQAGERHLAVAINNEVIPRTQFSQQILQSGDAVEILHPVGGG